MEADQIPQISHSMESKVKLQRTININVALHSPDCLEERRGSCTTLTATAFDI